MNDRLDYALRPATPADQPVIRRMVMSECLNPRDIRWQNFLVAEADDAVIGIGQIRVHDTCKELGSLVVLAEYRGLGIGAALMRALEARAGYPLFLMCGSHNVAYYHRSGWKLATGADIPPEMLPPAWVMWIVTHVLMSKIHIMRKDA
jgi:N-acetylglutamate synthase-like GNAT family acetyltransferase